jgi:hypothetical protein
MCAMNARALLPYTLAALFQVAACASPANTPATAPAPASAPADAKPLAKLHGG